MKIINKSIIAVLLAVPLMGLSGQALAATTVGLGTADVFAILAGTPVISDAGGASVITGNVGLSPASGAGIGLLSAQVTGAIYAVNGAGPSGSINDPALLTIAKNDLTAAYIDAAGRTSTNTFVSGDNQLGGQTLTPGVYAFGHASTANITAASPLVLDAQNDSSAVFIFQASSDLITASASVVQLVNGAQACNVFWQVTSSTTLGSGSTFVGTIMSLTDVGLNTGATINGRALARNGQVTLDHNTITRSVCAASSTSSTVGAKLPKTGVGSPSSSAEDSLAIAAVAITVAGVYYATRKQSKNS